MDPPNFSASPVRYGLDAETYQKMKSKFGPDMQQKAVEWIEELTGEQVGPDFHSGLKNGVILCKLLNKIRPGTVPKFVERPGHVLVERENIQAFINGCAALGVPSQELFVISDLHERKMIPAVIQNIYALGRQAQVTPGFNGPRLGVRYSVTPEMVAQRRMTKDAEAMKAYAVAKDRESKQVERRDYLEQQKKEEAIIKKAEDEKRVRSRRLTRGELELPLPQAIKLDTTSISISPIRYGMDLEVHEKMKSKHDKNEEEICMDWIELITGDPVDHFHKSLKSGVLLCKVLNKIRPGIIPKINPKPIPLLERENIQLFLNGAAKIGVPLHDLFVVSDLYEKKDLGAVMKTIIAVSRVAEHNPAIPKYGIRVAESKATETTPLKGPQPSSTPSPVTAPAAAAPTPAETNSRCCSCNIL